eukprot:62046-Prymnesium_polylepis.1
MARHASDRGARSPHLAAVGGEHDPPPFSSSFEPAPGPACLAGHLALRLHARTRTTAVSRRPPRPRSHEPAARRRPAGV